MEFASASFFIGSSIISRSAPRPVSEPSAPIHIILLFVFSLKLLAACISFLISI